VGFKVLSKHLVSCLFDTSTCVRGQGDLHLALGAHGNRYLFLLTCLELRQIDLDLLVAISLNESGVSVSSTRQGIWPITKHNLVLAASSHHDGHVKCASVLGGQLKNLVDQLFKVF